MVRPDYQPFKRRRESGSFKKRSPICWGVFPLRPWVARKSSIGHGHLFDCQLQTFYRADVPPTGRYTGMLLKFVPQCGIITCIELG
ncbi:hypothetical protein TNIN_424641 [Trichonephila inaurata madagascariensis]|uniref:Uncharacterized protein n=1 Tax=Trichonephila inaurata madagascariensis TaxID=2747483 RepID=A0A8X6WXX7_9ARAC|nr:hypothetical protein TNIN_424641 [Trichonephila inaurata madagascariensis]